MQPADILLTMVRDGAIIARNPTIGTFLLRASGASKFVSAPISGLDVQYLIGRDLISATSTTYDGMEIYLLTAEGRRHARSTLPDAPMGETGAAGKTVGGSTPGDSPVMMAVGSKL
jgi:hypothetical protein